MKTNKKSLVGKYLTRERMKTHMMLLLTMSLFLTAGCSVTSQPIGTPAENKQAEDWHQINGKDPDVFFKDKPDPNPEDDFLIGSDNGYEGIVEEDFEKLKQDLDEAADRDMKVVVSVLSLPGDRWRQFHNRSNDDRIWQDYKYHEQAAQFWTDLATRLKDYPAVIGYNLINERHTETAA